jgi:hypothetical protein
MAKPPIQPFYADWHTAESSGRDSQSTAEARREAALIRPGIPLKFLLCHHFFTFAGFIPSL